MTNKQQRIKRHEELKALLAEFGLRLTAWEPGVAARDKGGPLDFGDREWQWLEPLLRELKQRREQEPHSVGE